MCCLRCCNNNRSTRWLGKNWRCYSDLETTAISVLAEACGGMNIGISVRHSSAFMGRRPRLSGILALSLIFLFPKAFEAQQSASVRKKAPPQTAKTQAHFPEVEELLRQGLIEQAKEKIQEKLQRSPSSVEGYNLLGIIYSDQKDYTNALEAFQHALKLSPNSTRT